MKMVSLDRRVGSQDRRLRGKASSQFVVGSQEAVVAPTEDSVRRFLDEVYQAITSPTAEAETIKAAVDQLFRGLRILRQACLPDQWRKLIDAGRAHPLCDVVHEDPFTKRAFEKPRGYAGDAVMMDYIYSREEEWPRPAASERGTAIFDYTTAAPASAGVRERRCYVAEMLDKLGRQKNGQHVLAIAAGHLREASLSSAVRRNRFGRFVAMDADEQSVSEVRQRYGRYSVEAVVANVRRMLTGRLDLGTFDLVYTTGLYDYLADSTAKRLTANLFQHVRPGGRLVIANFLPEIRDVGYMEMFMDWHLVYRTRGQMLSLADEVVQSTVEEIRVTAESNENVVVMELTKR